MRNAWGCPVRAALSLAPEDARWNPTERSHYYESESIKNAVGTRDRVTYSNPSVRLFVRPPRSRHLKRFWKLNESSRQSVMSTTLYTDEAERFSQFFILGFLTPREPNMWARFSPFSEGITSPHTYYHTQTLTYGKRISFLIIEQVWIMCDIQPIESEKNLPKTTYCDQSKHIFFINTEYKVS